MSAVFAFAVFTLTASDNPVRASDAPVEQPQHRPVAGIVIRPAWLEQVLSEERTETKPITKTILGSAVTGTQSTLTRVTASVKPDSDRLQFELRNSGTVSSSTSSRNSQALIDSSGAHSFDVIKPVYFDGSRWLTQKCFGSIQARQTPVRVVTSFSGSPLFGPAADQIAWREVIRRGPEIDQAVAEDLSRDILPEIDRQTDVELAELDQQWKQVQRALEMNFPDAGLEWRANSSQTAVLLSLVTSQTPQSRSVAEVREQIFRDRSQVLNEHEDVVVWMSEEAATDLMGRFMPQGMLTDAALTEIVRRVTSGEINWTGKTLAEIATELRSTSDRPAVLYSMEFAESSPLDVQFRDGRIRISARMQVHPRLGAPSGWFSAVTEYQGAAIGRDLWTVRNMRIEAKPDEAFTVLKIPSDDSELRPQEPADSGLPWKSLIETSVRGLLERIPEPEIPRTLELSAINRKLSNPRIHRIQCEDGWMRISLAF